MTRQLTHLELLYRPGERALAAKLLRLLGCEPADRNGIWFTSFIDPAAARDYANNVVYASEVGAEQWRLEQSLVVQSPAERADYLAHLRAHPQRSAHFGIRVGERSELDELAQRVAAAADDPELAGRVAVDGIFEPDAPGAIAPNMVQLFVWTDIVAAGLLTLGQHIEIQWHLPQA